MSTCTPMLSHGQILGAMTQPVVDVILQRLRAARGTKENKASTAGMLSKGFTSPDAVTASMVCAGCRKLLW